MNAHIITIGDEILIGQIIDTNSAWIGTQLNELGIKVTEIKTISDDYNAIQRSVIESTEKADLVLTTGGLGATKDDITKKAISEALGIDLKLDEALYLKITEAFTARNIPIQKEALKKQCLMPESALQLENKLGTAPGMWFEHNESIIVSMPGVPYEMKHLMELQILPRLKDRTGDTPICHKTIRTAGIGETSIAEKIESVLETFPDYMKIAYLPNLGEVRLRISAYGTAAQTEAQLQQEVEAKATAIEQILGNKVFGYEEENIQDVLGKILVDNKWTLSLAESCTGGNIAAKVVTTPGASQYFMGGLISYANEVKMQELGVQESTLRTHGAVSEQTVQEMVQGAIQKFGTDTAIAVSGIAGPTGGTEEKPVGLIWVAVAFKNQIKTHKLLLSKSRTQNIEYTAKRALNLLRLLLLEQV